MTELSRAQFGVYHIAGNMVPSVGPANMGDYVYFSDPPLNFTLDMMRTLVSSLQTWFGIGMPSVTINSALAISDMVSYVGSEIDRSRVDQINTDQMSWVAALI